MTLAYFENHFSSGNLWLDSQVGKNANYYRKSFPPGIGNISVQERNNPEVIFPSSGSSPDAKAIENSLKQVWIDMAQILQANIIQLQPIDIEKDIDVIFPEKNKNIAIFEAEFVGQAKPSINLDGLI